MHPHVVVAPPHNLVPRCGPEKGTSGIHCSFTVKYDDVLYTVTLHDCAQSVCIAANYCST